MIIVNYIPVREKLEYVVEQAERQKIRLREKREKEKSLEVQDGQNSSDELTECEEGQNMNLSM